MASQSTADLTDEDVRRLIAETYGDELARTGPRLDLSSANGERQAEPPRPEGRRLPAALRFERPSAREFH
jgi:hypothetical protein